MKYRPDIDGLRSLAILPVVLYHSGLPGISGGFIGVDVFFVISGYLITSIIVGDVQRGAFSLLTFYERRARRILPALAGVMVAVFAVGWFVLLPSEFAQLGASAIASAFFVSNMYFLSELNYFGPAVEFTPLLHTWSLAVEEQFYLFFPPLLAVLLGRWGSRAAILAVVLFSVLSFVAAVAFLADKPTWVFFVIIFRAWELGAGAALALITLPHLTSKVLRDVLGVTAILAILVPAVVYSSAWPFPGLAAVPPVLGAAMLIYVGGAGGSIATRAISHPWLVGIGLISYSLYLWHWPIMAFARIVTDNTDLALPLALATIAASFTMAWLSYRFIERPFRARPPQGFSRPAIFSMSGAVTFFAVGVGLALVLTGGLPGRVPEPVQILAAAKLDTNPTRQTCYNKIPQEGLCQIGAPKEDDAPFDFLFWGDSHADAMVAGIDIAAKNAGKTGLYAGASACPPVRYVQRSPENTSCTRFLRAVWEHLETRSDAPVVIFAARWTLSTEGRRYRTETGADVKLNWVGAQDKAPANLDNAAILQAGLAQTILDIQKTGREVVLLGPIPEVGHDVPTSLARKALLGWAAAPHLTRADFEKRAQRTENLLRSVAEDYPGTRYLALSGAFCGPAECAIVDDKGIPLYYDDDHLSLSAAKSILPAEFSKIWPQD